MHMCRFTLVFAGYKFALTFELVNFQTSSSQMKRNLAALLLLSYRCIGTINVLWLSLKEPWVGLQCLIVLIPKHTHVCTFLSF